MFKTNNKGGANLVIIIVSIVVGLLILGTVAGIIIWKVVGEEETKRKRESEEEEEIKDCGVSDIFLTADSASPLEIDFEQDKTMVCLGKNIKNNCKEATAFVRMGDFDLFYKVLGKTKSDCKIRLEVDLDGDIIYVECPLSGLIGLTDVSPYYRDLFEEKLSAGPGDYAASILLLINILAEEDWDIGQQVVGCTGNFD